MQARQYITDNKYAFIFVTSGLWSVWLGNISYTYVFLRIFSVDPHGNQPVLVSTAGLSSVNCLCPFCYTGLTVLCGTNQKSH